MEMIRPFLSCRVQSPLEVQPRAARTQVDSLDSLDYRVDVLALDDRLHEFRIFNRAVDKGVPAIDQVVRRFLPPGRRASRAS